MDENGTVDMASCKAKRKQTDLSLNQKLEIIQLSSEKVSHTHLVQKFGCSLSTISKILPQKDEIRQDAAENKVKDRKCNDETGIYYCALLDGSLTFSTDHLSSSKKAKDHITALVAVNMDGSDKCPLLIVGKSRQPQYFRGVQQLPLPYSNNKNV